MGHIVLQLWLHPSHRTSTQPPSPPSQQSHHGDRQRPRPEPPHFESPHDGPPLGTWPQLLPGRTGDLGADSPGGYDGPGSTGGGALPVEVGLAGFHLPGPSLRPSTPSPPRLQLFPPGMEPSTPPRPAAKPEPAKAKFKLSRPVPDQSWAPATPSSSAEPQGADEAEEELSSLEEEEEEDEEEEESKKGSRSFSGGPSRGRPDRTTR